MANWVCARCVRGKNCLNGRWCDVLGRYVEYDREPMCGGVVRRRDR